MGGLRNSLCLATLTAALVPASTHATPSSAPNQASPATYRAFAYNRSASLNLVSVPLATFNGVKVEAISFDSPRGGRVGGRIFVPGGAGPFAGVVIGHGAPGSAEQSTARAVYIARHGAVVVVINGPFNRRAGEPFSHTPRDRDEQVQFVVDLERAVDLIAQRPDVDPNRLAYVGRSYGGVIGAILAGVETRFKTFILTSADGGITARYRTPAMKLERNDRRWLAIVDPVEPYHFVGNSTVPILFQNSRVDSIVTPARAEALQALVKRKEVRWYDEDHFLGPRAFVDQLAWLARTIGTTPPGYADQSGPQWKSLTK